MQRQCQISYYARNHTSWNVVGYQTVELENGFAGKGATFVPVTGTKINLQDIKVTGYEGETADEIQIQILDTLGRTTTQYFFADLPDDDIYGWLDANEEIPQNVEFAPGAGLWVKSANNSLALQFAGQVPTSDISVSLREGFTMVANATPIALNLQGIGVAGYEGEIADAVQIQTLDTLGRTVDQYFFADLPDDDIFGWLDANEDIPENITFKPGMGLWVKSNDASLSLVIPGIEL